MTLLKKVLASALIGFGLAGNAAALTEGTDYEVLPKAMPQTQKDKIEVLEFFGYFCIHCKNLDPVIRKHVKTFASDTYFQTDHVVWDESGHIGFARLAAAVNQTNLKDKANPEIYKAIFEEKRDFNDPGATIEWMKAQKAFDGKKLLTAYNSFSNQAQAKQMMVRTAEYGINSTPTVIVGGKYRVLFPKGFVEGMQTIDDLVQKVRDERGMKKPAPKPKAAAPKSKGLAITGAANR